MFGKPPKKAIVKMNYREPGFGGSSTTLPLSDGKLFQHLQASYERHGELTISLVSADELFLTTSRTIEYQDMDQRAEEVADLVRNYIQGKAIPMKAYAIFARGELKGVFHEKSHAGFKSQKLARDGYTPEEIQISPINIGSFVDFEEATPEEEE